MKKLLVVLGMFALVGGGVASLWFYGVPPFGKKAKPGKAAATKLATAKRPNGTPASGTDASKDGVSSGSDESVSAGRKPAVADSGNGKPGASSSKGAASAAKQSEANLTRMASVYEQMPVDDASRIFAKLPDSAVEPLLRRMDEGQMGKLLMTFPPDRAAKLTLSMTKSPEPAVITH